MIAVFFLYFALLSDIVKIYEHGGEIPRSGQSGHSLLVSPAK